MKIKFFGEGAADIGNPNSEYKANLLAAFLKNILSHQCKRDISFKPVCNLIPRIQRRGLKNKIMLAIRKAQNANCKAAIFVMDGSGKGWEKRLDSMRAGRDAAINEHGLYNIALGLARMEIETWLLADNQACRNHLGKRGGDLHQGDLEELKDPKSELAKLYGEQKSQGGTELSLPEARMCIANEANIDRLRKLSHFNRFYEDVKEQIFPLFNNALEK